MEEDFVGSLIGGVSMGVTEVMSSAAEVITAAITTAGQLTTALPFFTLFVGFVFGRKLIGQAKGLLMAGGRRRR